MYLPDVIEDGGVWKSKGRNRVVQWITGILCLAVHIKINAILYKFGQGLKFASKLPYNKLYSPDFCEDGGVRIS